MEGSEKLLKKSTQWDIVGIGALLWGLGLLIFLFSPYSHNVNPHVGFVWLVVSGFSVILGFICLVLGYFEGKKEES